MSREQVRAFSGSGPGEQTPDGCSVELYRRLPYRGDLDDVAELFRSGDTVLELGCGSGRLARWLLARGLHVTGVDESAAMLACVPAGVLTVQSTIQALRLPTRHDTVLLASHLINHPQAATRAAFLACARRHLRPAGRALLQRLDDIWLATVQPGPAGTSGEIALAVEAVARDGDRVRMALRYDAPDAVWRQSFAAVGLSQAQVDEELRRAGFVDLRWHGHARLWASASA